MIRNRSANRKGTVLVCVIACLAVATVLIALSVQVCFAQSSRGSPSIATPSNRVAL